MECPLRECEEADVLSVNPVYVNLNISYDYSELPQTLDLTSYVISLTSMALDLARVKALNNDTGEFIQLNSSYIDVFTTDSASLITMSDVAIG